MELIFESKIIYIDIEKPVEQLVTVIDNITISEKYQPNSHEHGEYNLLLKKEINSLTEAEDAVIELNAKANLLNKLMTYVIGHPITIKNRDSYGSNLQWSIPDKIDGWHSNYQDIIKAFEKNNTQQKYFIEIEIGNPLHYSIIEASPLIELVSVHNNYSRLSNLVKTLIRFHTLALHQEFDVKYVLLGKSLEIAEILLPVPENASKSFKHLPSELQAEFNNRNISWLYQMSNYRFETRHVINKKSHDSLHIKMSKDEYYDYMYLADLLIKYLVRNKLGLEPIIFKRK